MTSKIGRSIPFINANNILMYSVYKMLILIKIIAQIYQILYHFHVSNVSVTLSFGITTLNFYGHEHLGMVECGILKLGHTAPYLQSYGPLFIFFVRAITSSFWPGFTKLY